MPIAWTNGGTPAINATNLNALAVTADIGSAGTPTDNALKAAYVASTTIHTIVQLTQAAYTALATKDSATLYVIVG